MNDKIWISDQTNDKIYIYDLTGAFVSAITTGLDNVRGINLVNNEVWVANDGNANGSTADSIIRYTTAGVFIGIYPAPNTSIFDIVDNKNGIVYVSGLDVNGIQKLSYTGASLGNLVGSAVFQNLQQINLMSNGNVLAAVFQNHSSSGNNAGVYVLSPANGSIINYYPVPAGNIRGVIQTDNGSILYTTGNALFSINPNTSVQTQIVSGQFQYMTKALIPQLSVDEVKNSTAKIFPNPATEFIMVESDASIKFLELYAADGRLIRKIKPSDDRMFKVSVSELSAGNYILVLYSESKVSKHQFIKK